MAYPKYQWRGVNNCFFTRNNSFRHDEGDWDLVAFISSVNGKWYAFKWKSTEPSTCIGTYDTEEEARSVAAAVWIMEDEGET